MTHKWIFMLTDNSEKIWIWIFTCCLRWEPTLVLRLWMSVRQCLLRPRSKACDPALPSSRLPQKQCPRSCVQKCLGGNGLAEYWRQHKGQSVGERGVFSSQSVSLYVTTRINFQDTLFTERQKAMLEALYHPSKNQHVLTEKNVSDFSGVFMFA